MNQLLELLQHPACANICSGLLGTIIGIVFIPWYKNRRAIKAFIQYFGHKHHLKVERGKSIYEVISQHYILASDHYRDFIDEIYSNGLVPSDVVHYINNRVSVPLRISADTFSVKFPYNNDIMCILYKCRKHILISFLVIAGIIVYKFYI